MRKIRFYSIKKRNKSHFFSLNILGLHVLHIRAKYTHEKSMRFQASVYYYKAFIKLIFMKKIMRLNLVGLRAWEIKVGGSTKLKTKI